MSVRLERLLAMDAAIRGGGYPSVQAFIDRFEVSERTVRADLAFMRERLNAPLEHDRGRGGYYYTAPTWVLPTMFATEGELLAFFLSVELTRRYLGTTFEAPLRKTAAALALSLHQRLQLDLRLLKEALPVPPGRQVSRYERVTVSVTAFHYNFLQPRSKNRNIYGVRMLCWSQLRRRA